MIDGCSFAGGLRVVAPWRTIHESHGHRAIPLANRGPPASRARRGKQRRSVPQGGPRGSACRRKASPRRRFSFRSRDPATGRIEAAGPGGQAPRASPFVGGGILGFRGHPVSLSTRTRRQSVRRWRSSQFGRLSRARAPGNHRQSSNHTTSGLGSRQPFGPGPVRGFPGLPHGSRGASGIASGILRADGGGRAVVPFRSFRFPRRPSPRRRTFTPRHPLFPNDARFARPVEDARGGVSTPSLGDVFFFELVRLTSSFRPEIPSWSIARYRPIDEISSIWSRFLCSLNGRWRAEEIFPINFEPLSAAW